MKSQLPTAKSQLPPRRRPGKVLILGLIAVLPVNADDGPVRLGGPNAKQPQAAVGPDGRAYVVWAEEDAVRLAAAPKVGEAFGEPVTVGEVGRLMSGMRRGPRVAANGKTVVVTAIGMRTGNLVAWRSEDGGKVWTGPATVNGKPEAAREGLQDLAADRRGRFCAVWLDLREPGTQIWGARSEDEGRTWSERRIYRSPSGTVCECCPPSLAASGNPWVLFRNDVDGNRDMYLTPDPWERGEGAGLPRRLGAESWKLGSCPMAGGAVTEASAGRPTAVWHRDGVLYLTPGTGGEQRLGRGFAAAIAAGPGGAFVVWHQEKNGGGVRLLRPGGKPERLAEDGAWPVVAGDPKAGVIAAWEEGGAIRVQALTQGR